MGTIEHRDVEQAYTRIKVNAKVAKKREARSQNRAQTQVQSQVQAPAPVQVQEAPLSSSRARLRPGESYTSPYRKVDFMKSETFNDYLKKKEGQHIPGYFGKEF